MRKESKQFTAPDTSAHVSGYHSNGNGNFGFKTLGYFTSDRMIACHLEPSSAPDNHYGVIVRNDGEQMKGFGLEIECECSVINDSDALAKVFDKIIFPEFKQGDKLFKMQHDGSLGGHSSVEVITQPMTMDRIRNTYNKGFRQMFNHWFPSFGISAGSENCGMHVNISNGVFGETKDVQDLAIRKFYYIINKHFDVMRKAVMRKGSTHYCAQMSYHDAKTMDLYNVYTNHSVCFNLGHMKDGRIELRLVAGQKDYHAFRNTMEVVFHLCKAVTYLTWEQCDDLVAIFSGCNQYVVKRLDTEHCVGSETLHKILEHMKEVEWNA